jgi:hypothetical protein
MTRREFVHRSGLKRFGTQRLIQGQATVDVRQFEIRIQAKRIRSKKVVEALELCLGSVAVQTCTHEGVEFCVSVHALAL